MNAISIENSSNNVFKSPEKNKKLHLATWAKYHCNAVINDTMKCHNCNNPLFIDSKNNNLLKCLTCNYSIEPSKLTWKCIICKSEFTSEAKIYNPNEFLIMKSAIKDTLKQGNKAFPLEDEIEFTCNCPIDFKSKFFFHKKTCKGSLFKGILNGRKIIVCNQCHSLNYNDNFVWMCPICEQRTGINIKEKGKIKRIDSNKFKRNYSGIKILKLDSKEMKTPNKSEMKNGLNELVRKTSGNISPFQVPLPCSAIKYKMQMNKENDSKLSNLKGHSSRDLNKDLNINVVFNKEEINQLKYVQQQLVNKIYDDDCNKIPISPSPKKKINFDNEFPAILKKKSLVEKKINYDDFDSDEYEIKQKIGEGSFGQIYLVERNSKKFAMKKIIGTSEYDFDSLQHEYDILRQLSNSKKINVVKIYGVQNKKLDRTTSVVYILMELAECDWDKEINMRNKNNQFYKENEIKNIMKSLISSFCNLQKEKITHRDIKPQNILKIKDNIYKIADFGEAKELMKNKSNTDMQTIRGTELFMSPILFNAVRKQRLNNNTIIHNIYKSDVFSLGFCFLYAMTLDIKCLYDIREETDQNKMEKEIRRFIGKKYGEDIINIIIIMLKLEENERLDFIDLNNLMHKIGF